MSLSESEQARYARHLALSEIGDRRTRTDQGGARAGGGRRGPRISRGALSGGRRLRHARTGGLRPRRALEPAAPGAVRYPQPRRAKADAGAERLAALNPEIRVVAHELELRAANVRALVERLRPGARRHRPTCNALRGERCLRAAGASRWCRRRYTASRASSSPTCPGRGPCYRCLFPQAADGMVGELRRGGRLGVLPGVLGALQATEAIKIITGPASRCSGACSPMTRSRCASASFVSGAAARLRRVRRCADHHRTAGSTAHGRNGEAAGVRRLVAC